MQLPCHDKQADKVWHTLSHTSPTLSELGWRWGDINLHPEFVCTWLTALFKWIVYISAVTYDLRKSKEILRHLTNTVCDNSHQQLSEREVAYCLVSFGWPCRTLWSCTKSLFLTSILKIVRNHYRENDVHSCTMSCLSYYSVNGLSTMTRIPLVATPVKLLVLAWMITVSLKFLSN